MKTTAGANLILYVGILLVTSCSSETDLVYRSHMRTFVQQISAYAETSSDSFFVIPQNGIELVFIEEVANEKPAYAYLSAIDAVGQEDLFYGFRADNRATPEHETDYLLEYLRFCEQQGLKVLVTDYCSDAEKVDDSYAKNLEENFLSFAAPERELNRIPSYPSALTGSNNDDISTPSEAKNFLYLINPEQFVIKSELIDAVAESSYDLVILDLFFGNDLLNLVDMSQLKTKPQGGRRLVFAYMSIGEAEDYRYYWNNEWRDKPPSWLLEENPDWKGNYLVKYWDTEWKSIIYGSDTAYLDRIMAAGFDGVYLDIIEAFEYFE